MGGSEPRQLCAKVRKCNIEEKTQTKVTKVPERKCDQIPYPRQVCRVEQVQDPPQMVSVKDTVSDIETWMPLNQLYSRVKAVLCSVRSEAEYI